jgi:hypothetical protein
MNRIITIIYYNNNGNPVRFRPVCSDAFPCFNHFNNPQVLGCILTSPDCNHSPCTIGCDVIKQ